VSEGRALADDDPVPLRAAVELFFPLGGMTLSKLRAQAEKGNLAIERIGRTEFVTARAIREMRARCREQESRHASKPAESRTESSSGSSETAKHIAARDALLTRLETPNSRFANISRTKAKDRTRNNVSPLRPASQT
jgi:hypothetical protein